MVRESQGEMALIDPATATPTSVASQSAASLARRTLKDAIVPIIGGVAILYFGREFFIPLALAVLLAFLLAPVIRKLEKWKLGRITSVVAVTLLAFGFIGGTGYLVGGQLIDLAEELPSYKQNLLEKISAFKVPQNSPFSRAKETIQEVTKELTNEAPRNTFPENKEQAPTVAEQVPAATEAPDGAKLLKVNQPVPVSVVEGPRNAFQTIESIASPIVGPLGTAAIVIVFVIFMLLEREDLRDRVIHLVGRGNLHMTTQAVDEASHRVSRYLLAQCIVNVTYGIPVGIGLALLGIPNAFLWGLLATLLRFVPYIGPWIAAAFPVILSLATAKGWMTPLMVIGLFLVLELISNNVVEPWLYGSSTGLSPMAVIVSAAFWTWLWGGVGLLLATPLTVCLVVLGKYLPHLSFLDVLLGDKPPIAAEDRFYQRLLATDEDEVCEIAENYTRTHSLQAAYDRLIIPAVRLAEDDFRRGSLTEANRVKLFAIARDLVTEIGEGELTMREVRKGEVPDVVCVSANDYADELACMMLARLLAAHEITVQVVPSSLLMSETIEAAEAARGNIICISALPPGATRHALYTTRRLRERVPNARILAGLWGEPANDERRTQRLAKARLDGVYISLQSMVNDVVATVRELPSRDAQAKQQAEVPLVSTGPQPAAS